MSVYANPRSDLVALRDGPRHGRWFFYRDWLTTRSASRRMRYPLDHHCAATRCYLPTTDTATNTDPNAIAHGHTHARIWTWVTPAQWQRWGREYLTPEESAGASWPDIEQTGEAA
ncbi:hypothetical protein [Actinokineospora terrae]|uniref:Uncharacterized protein n=1 Tax=Actinokineospora terrae TaxID=155974 RepID=A0A1H9VFY5_9PSEU|nr:hypothetical protein [Actinokineospora terrae]SES20605.1 hypothetical protein SAMN04487818_108339 [Actinokineospora terrae]